jgi:hypothetical protein
MARALMDDYFYYKDLGSAPTYEQIMEISKGISTTTEENDLNE